MALLGRGREGVDEQTGGMGKIKGEGQKGPRGGEGRGKAIFAGSCKQSGSAKCQRR